MASPLDPASSDAQMHSGALANQLQSQSIHIACSLTDKILRASEESIVKRVEHNPLAELSEYDMPDALEKLLEVSTVLPLSMRPHVL